MAAVSAKRKFQLCSIAMKCQKPCTLRLSASIVPRKLLDLLGVSIAEKYLLLKDVTLLMADLHSLSLLGATKISYMTQL